MFKIPDWESDIPSPTTKFAKKANNIKSSKINETDFSSISVISYNKKEKSKEQETSNNNLRNTSIHYSKKGNNNCNKNYWEKPMRDEAKNNKKEESHKRDFIKSPKKWKQTDINGNELRNKENATQKGINTNRGRELKVAKKRKYSDDNKINQDMEIDEMLLNAKRKELMKEFQKVDREDLLFSETNEHEKSNQGNTKQNLISKNKSKLKPNDAKTPKKKKNKIDHESESDNLTSPKQIKLAPEPPEIEHEPSFHKNKNEERKKKMLKTLLQNNHRRSINLGSKSDQLRERMLERFKSAQFRFLNEKLYTSSGDEAKQIFQTDPQAFDTYHQGYQQQVKKWPVNPLDIIVKKILKMPQNYVIADMGCGEAALSRRVPHTVRSFDLVALAPGVEVCDIARTPLLPASVHVAVYCLALMGTDLTQYLLEANRVLKQGGQLLIAEVESRFDDVNSFTRDVERLGFKLKSLDNEHKVFFFMHFQKIQDPPKKGKPVLQLKPCLYKKR